MNFKISGLQSVLVITYLGFRLADMLLLKEELAVKIADVNCVQVDLQNNVDAMSMMCET